MSKLIVEKTEYESNGIERSEIYRQELSLQEEYFNDNGEVENNQITGYSIGEDEPEDMIFGRELQYLENIEKMIEKAYEAGKNGEELEFRQETEE